MQEKLRIWIKSDFNNCAPTSCSRAGVNRVSNQRGDIISQQMEVQRWEDNKWQTLGAKLLHQTLSIRETKTTSSM